MRTVLVFVVVMAAAPAIAAPITLIHDLQFRGTFDGKNISLRSIRITVEADTEDVIVESDILRWIPHDSRAIVEIPEYGAFAILDQTRTNWTRNFFTGTVGIDTPFNGVQTGPTSESLVDWRMDTSIGPVIGIGSWAAVPIHTSGGTLVSNLTSGQAVFTAIVVPEPSSLILLVGALGFASALARRRG